VPVPIDVAIIVVNALSGAALAVLLGVLVWVSWMVKRSGPSVHTQVVRALRGRLRPVLWVLCAVFAASALLGETSNAGLGLPHPWDAATATQHRAHALLGLGAYVLTAQVLLGLWVMARPNTVGTLAVRTRVPRSRTAAADLGAALLSTVCLTAAIFAVAAMGAVGYTRLAAHVLT